MMGERSPVRLHCVVDGPVHPGTGPPLLFAGSLGATLDMWRPQLPVFAGDRRVIRVDHRGHGGSPVPAGPYSVAELAGDVLALLDRLELDRVDFVGLSLGGMVGMYLGSEAAERINRLVLLATSAHFPDPTRWIERIKAVSEGGTESVARSVVARWFTPEYARANPQVVAEAEGMVRDTSDVGYLGCAQAVRDFDHVYRLSAITAPTLLVGGSADQATSPDPHARTIAEHLPGVRYQEVAAAHLLSVERAEEVNDLIADHLG